MFQDMDRMDARINQSNIIYKIHIAAWMDMLRRVLGHNSVSDRKII